MGTFLHTDFDAPSITLKKTKNEMLQGTTRHFGSVPFKVLFLRANDLPARSRYSREVNMSLVLHVNGAAREVAADPETPLLYVLRNDLKLKGARYGCGLGQCGACTVIIDGKAIQSCDVPVSAAAGKSVTTIEGIGSPDRLHPLQRAFIGEQAAQCGYCISGIIMSTKALLDENPAPSDADIRAALARNLCRCGTHTRILRAIRSVVAGGLK
jgi:nicotinate dehydrogenase subunit A